MHDVPAPRIVRASPQSFSLTYLIYIQVLHFRKIPYSTQEVKNIFFKTYYQDLLKVSLSLLGLFPEKKNYFT